VEQSPAGFVAYAALSGIVLLALYAFRRFRVADAAMFTVLVAVLFGPIRAAFKIPFVPALGKESIAYLSVLVILLFRHRGHVRRARVDRTHDLLPILGALGGIATGLTNTDPLTYGSWSVTQLQGMNLKDGLFMTASSLLVYLLPFYLGRAIVRDGRDLHSVVRALAVFGLVYAPFAALEMRISPQLHAMVYGYAPHEDFLQTMRMGGYRPNVFMAHGLAVAVFFVVATLAMATLDRRERIWRFTAQQWTWFLAIILVLCKSMGAIIYAALLLPLVLRASPKAQVRVAALIAVVVFAYPALRAYDLVPVDQMLEWARFLGDDRAQSLHVRFYNEGVVLERARERLMFGWGTYGRHLVYDPGSGETRIVTDGAWIIFVSMSGVLGLLTTIGTLLASIVSAWRRLALVPLQMRRDVGGLTLIVAATSLDLIPNGLFSAYPFMLAGALTSAVGAAAAYERVQARSAAVSTAPRSLVLDEPRPTPA
jgi:hypothetical protein